MKKKVLTAAIAAMCLVGTVSVVPIAGVAENVQEQTVLTENNDVIYGIGVSKEPDKTTYKIGEQLDLTGLRLNGSYRMGELISTIIDEDYQELLNSNVPIKIDASEFDNTKAGRYHIYVVYGNTKTSFTVTVYDDAITTTIAVTETKPVTTITMPVLDDTTLQTEVVTVTVMSVNGDDILVKPVDGSPELKSSNKFSLSAKKFPDDIKPKAGMKLEITYNGDILETYPAQFGNVQKIVAVKDDTVKDDATLLKGTKDMTLNDVMRLAEKGDELDWSDFKDYKGRDVGSGLYIWEYKLDDGYVLSVGGDIMKKPMYILLSHDNDKGIDIRTENVKEYIASTATPVNSTALQGTKDLTVNDVMRLAEKGDELDWSDFKDYKGNDVGSGLHIWEFDVDRYNAKLRVGGSYLDAKPDYIKLIMKNGVEVDVRTEDLSRWFGYDGQSSKATVKGDANCDSDVNMSDAVIIMQSLANPAQYGVNGTDKNHITEQGKINGDIAGNNDGITNADALAVQKKLLGLDKTDVQSIDNSLIANKVFVYEKSADPGIYDDLCDLSFGSNGTYSYNIGYYRSSNQDQGTWTISGDILVLTGQYGTNKFRYEDKALVYIAESSDGFSDFNDKSTPKDGEKFILAEEPDYATINNLPEIVTIKSDYNPIMSDCSGIGILLEFDSKDYSISLRTDDGHFTTWDIAKGNGPIENAGKTYKIGNSGYIFWTPDEINFDADYKNEIVIIGEKDGKSVKLGNIVVTTSNSHTLTAVLK